MDKVERHFVLVHGACHGAWCWYKLATLLRSAGHRVTALDMAASGVHPKRLDEVCSLLDYCEPLTEFMEYLPVDDRVVLVGHSMGGICISVAMERYPEKISFAVFITAFMPGPNLDFPTINQEDFTLASLLVRPLASFNEAEVLKEISLTKEKYGSVRRVYIVSDQDNVIKEDLQRWMIENNPTDEVQAISGSDHMVMFSKPQELCTFLQEIAVNYC
ncbi:methyl jasmonate esterase 1-like isoform X2 [Cornus florida]|uniref:methyl jasmonate esterase 1-like isoform X2 n=1 Tax=Cornus florida TaxID=4283 RepID=UPI00289F09BD|nr:methyl jasmonate esterase 1-like isoform X2 [Cornus florida]